MSRHVYVAQYLFTILVIVANVPPADNYQGWVVEDSGCRTPDKGVGDCIPIKQCKTMIDYLISHKRPYSAFVTQRLQEYICSYRDNIVHVCCPKTPINIEESVPATLPTTPLMVTTEPTTSTTFPTAQDKQDMIEGVADFSDHKQLNLLPSVNCGYLGTEDRIRNGQNAKLNEFPWMALLSYKTENGPTFKCGGTIINTRYILTAAHCITNLKKSPLLGVRIGEHNIMNTTDCEIQEDGTTKCNGPVQDLAIEEIIPHPDYNLSDISNDIGLLRVSKMNLTIESTRPVCLPIDSAKGNKFNYGIVTGWGSTGVGEPSTNILQKVELRMVDSEKCSEVYQGKVNTIKQLCAGGKGAKDSCGGDSGGPLHSAAYLFDDIRYVQYGIVSFGPRFCGSTGFPGVYTKVEYYMKWILDTIKP